MLIHRLDRAYTQLNKRLPHPWRVSRLRMNTDTMEHRPPVRILVQVEAQTDVISKGDETDSRPSIVDSQLIDGAGEELFRLREVALSDAAGSVEHNDNVLGNSAVIYNDEKLAVDDTLPTIAGLFGRRSKRDGGTERM